MKKHSFKWRVLIKKDFFWAKETVRRNELWNLPPRNIEGISASKSDYLSRLMREHEIDIDAIQETDLLNRGILPRLNLIGAIHSNVHGIATYVRDTLASRLLSYYA
jgi:hypothetical protein